MERARHRKSKSASGIEGILQHQKAAPRLSADSRTYIDGSKRDDLFMLELGQSSWPRPTGTPMKKLLAEEMSRELEPRRRPPSVVARLMGLDGLPSPRHIHGQQKRLLETYQAKTRNLHYDARTNRSPPEFKDVYEDLEAASRRRCSSRWSASSILTKPELALIRQKLRVSDEMDQIPKHHSHHDSPVNRIAVLKPYESKGKHASRPAINSRREDGLLLERHRHPTHICRSPSRAQSEKGEEEKEKDLPTRIVVLKPNLGNIQNPTHISQRRKDSSRPVSKEAREIAREITMRMRDRYDETNDTWSVWGRGYAGDESSYEANESDSESEFEGFRFSRGKSFGYPSFAQVESSVSREAKKRLSERWKMTHSYRDMEVVNIKGSTLGEMLKLPDREAKHSRLNAKTSPSGISSRDGWTDEITRNTCRSKSLPPGGGGRRIRKTRSYREGLAEEKVVMSCETVNCGKSEFVKRNVRNEEDYLSRYSKSRGKKPHPRQDMYIGEIDTSTEANIEIQMEANIKDISEQQMAFEMSAKADACWSPVVDVVMISEPVSTTLSPEPSNLGQKQPSSVMEGDESAFQERGNCGAQELDKVATKPTSPSSACTGAELESSECSKEADHPSPTSVLEAPFMEDASSAECFERVGAELQELRLQLQLLKMESSTDAGVSTHFAIEEEDAQPSHIAPEENYTKNPQGWEAHYTLDVLIASGLPQELDFSIFKTSWYSSDCPLDPKLFDTLEKKYNDDDDDEKKWERKLLFDRISFALKQIFMEHVDPCPWVMPKSTGSNLVKWRAHGIIVDSVDDKVVEQLELPEVQMMSEKTVDREMGWVGPRGEVEMVGNEIERLLMDDMVAEVLLCM
ncbi:hypothetical protein STAS_31926 [Striga asiatica]|uniref:DUF4378 domain-containing protein n=1 Tax=Striga asiatica TaxID=4170 RepID=A0A5A7RAK6_STRAF|nr:hypothetical protein STAS_31926 [Striga asiatica]